MGATGEDTGKHVLTIAKLLPDRVGKAIVATDLDLQQLPRAFDRQIPEHNRIDDAEDGGVRADAQRKRQDGNRGECRTVLQIAEGIAEVMTKGVQQMR